MEFINSIIEKTNKYLKKLDLCKNNGKPTYILGNGEGADNAQKRAGNFVFSGRLVNKKYYDSNSSALCFEDFLDNFGDKINLVVACRNPDLHLINSYITKIQELLIFDCYSGNYSVDPELMTYDFVASNIQNFQSIYSELADDYSRKCFSAYINQKISFDFNYLSEVKTQPQYFEELITLNEDEVFVDCGAFDGDSALAFVSEINRRGIEQYNKIISFEPDPINFRKLIDKKLLNHECYNLGVSDWKGFINFEIMGTSSGISKNGNYSIEVSTLDDVIKDKVTFIKMDIEGEELNALHGGEQLIIKNHPKLAICIYHKKEDLWKIQQYIKSLCSDYRFFIRAYEDTATELVLYAI